MKNWLKLSIITEPVLVDAISDFVVGVIEAGVEVVEDDHLHLRRLNVYVEKHNLSPAESQGIVTQVMNYLAELSEIFKTGEPQLAWEILEEEDWGSTWKKYFTPFSITPGLVIAPTWENYQAKKGEKVLVMDPGMAFGTGHHATTTLVLSLMQEELLRSNRSHDVLDVGTGTGILAMAAALFGARKVLAVDNDPLAVAAAAENVERNRLSPVIEVGAVALGKIKESFSLVVVNIVHDVLLELADDLRSVTTEDGIVILSGILQGEQVDSITSAFVGRGFTLKEKRTSKEWAALQFRKNGLS